NKPLIVCPAGFDKNQFKGYEKHTHTTSLYFIGSLEWLPNREGLIWFIENCWQELKTQFPGIKFYIAGRNAPNDFISAINKKDIIFNGEVENAYDFIKDKSIMLVPLLSGSGMRIKIIEAFFMSKAVVSTSLGAAGTQGINEEHLLLADTAEAFIQQISRLINNPGLYKQIIVNAKKLAIKNFDNEQIAAKLHFFYKKITDTR
ncbi:MAG: glycosyltransferase family 4 protein, partial [Bacteroidales bacterium]|nr:glycosyltransferase family 4 protein [Bacteroidales bacterium]